jgi:circadian clock protein KaiB
LTRPRAGRRAPLRLRLYVAGESPNSNLARTNLQASIAHLASSEVSLEVIDVLRNPERGLVDGVLVTPTLIRITPSPEQRVIGNLRDTNALLAALGLSKVFGE